MRIPFALQTVFLQSQAGEDVEKIDAPQDGTAHRAYPPKVPKARGADAAKAKKEPMKKIGYRPVTNRQTAMSLKIFNRLSKQVTTAADATKSKLWQKASTPDASEELWVSGEVVSSEPTIFCCVIEINSCLLIEYNFFLKGSQNSGFFFRTLCPQQGNHQPSRIFGPRIGCQRLLGQEIFLLTHWISLSS